ncbi:zinc finger, CCHC-type containing protein [Tanacetum coccineum]
MLSLMRIDSHQFLNQVIPNGNKDIGGCHGSQKGFVQQPEPELRKSKRNRTPKDFGPEFQLYLIKGTREEVSDQHSYCFNVEDDPKTFDNKEGSQDVAFWKEAINDEMDSIMGNNTWVLADLPPRCKPLGCKWIFKRKLKVDETVEKFKARLVIQGFKQKSGIEYFDTYAPVAHISTIRMLIAMALIHNLVIHQMDVKTAFLNGDLDEEVYMNQPQGFIMPGNENKVCKLIKSLYGLKQAPKQWHQKFDEVVLSNGYSLNQANKCVYSKLDESCKGVIICLYVDDMLIFGTDQVQVDLTKEFLSSRFSMKDMEVSTPMDTSEKLMLNNGQAVSQLEYSRVIGSLMYAMICTRPNIAFVVGKLSRYTSNLGTQQWQAIQQKDTLMQAGLAILKTIRLPLARHNMNRDDHELRISIEFVMSQQNLADHSTKGLARDLIIKSAEGMGLNGVKHMYLHIIPMMCLEPAEKDDEVFTSQWLNILKKCLAGA